MELLEHRRVADRRHGSPFGATRAAAGPFARTEGRTIGPSGGRGGDRAPADDLRRAGPTTRPAAGWARPDYTRIVEDERFEEGMPALDRQPVRSPVLPPSLASLPARSVPETKPTPLQKHYVLLSAPAVVLGAVAITAVEAGAPLSSPLVKVCALIAAPLLAVANADAILRIWRSAWAWMPVDRGKGLFRLAWVALAAVLYVALLASAWLVLAG